MGKTYSQIKKEVLGKNYDINKNANKKKKTYEEIKADVKNGKYSFNKAKEDLEKKIGISTFASDLSSMGKTIEDSLSSWQTQETMNNTRSSVEAMRGRLSAYKEYVRLFGDKNKSDINGIERIQSSYRNVLDGWDDKAKRYGLYENADAYKKEQDELSKLYSMNSSDISPYLNDKKNTVAYTTADGYTIKWQDLYDDAYLREYTKKATSNPDFAKTSTYKKKDAKYEITYSGDSFAGDEDAHLYNLVNGDKDAKEHELLINVKMSGTNDDIRYQYLDEEEKRIFNSLWKTEGKDKAKEYLELLSPELRDRRIERERIFTEKLASESPFGSSAASVIQNVSNNLTAIPFMAMDYLEDNEINPNSSLYVGKRSVDTTRSTVENNIESGIGRFAYRGGMNIADNLATTVVSGAGMTGPMGKVMSSAMMSSGAFLDTTLDAKQRGLSDEQAFGLGTVSAIAEGVFESKGWDALFDKKTLAKNVWSYLANNALTEVSGELATEATNDIADVLVAQDRNKFKMEYDQYIKQGKSEKEAFNLTFKNGLFKYGEVAGQALLSSGVMAGTPAAISSAGQYYGNRNTGKAIIENSRTQDMLDIASQLTPEEYSAYETYSRYAKKGVNAENIKASQLGRLYNETYRDADTTLESENATAEQKTSALDTLSKLGKVATDNKAAKEKAKLDVGKETKITESGEKIDTSKFYAKGDDVLISTEDGEVSVDKMTLSDTDADLVAHAKVISQEDGETMANLFVQNYDGKTDIDAYANSFELVKTLSKKESFTDDDIIANKGVLTATQASEIFTVTRSEIKKANKQLREEAFAKAQKIIGKQGVVEDSVFAYDNNAKSGQVNWNRLSKKQQAAITFANGLFTAMGNNVVWTAGDRYANGAYSIEGDTIFIDAYAGMNVDTLTGTDTIINTISHELTHQMEVRSPETFSEVKEIVLDALETVAKFTDKSITRNDIIAKEIDRLDKEHSDKKHTEADAISELVAKACEDMLSVSEEGVKLFNSLSDSQKKTFTERIKDIIAKLKDWITELLNTYNSKSDEAKALRRMKESFDEVSKRWDKMLADIAKQNNAVMESGKVETKEQTTTETKTESVEKAEQTKVENKPKAEEKVSEEVKTESKESLEETKPSEEVKSTTESNKVETDVDINDASTKTFVSGNDGRKDGAIINEIGSDSIVRSIERDKVDVSKAMSSIAGQTIEMDVPVEIVYVPNSNGNNIYAMYFSQTKDDRGGQIASINSVGGAANFDNIFGMEFVNETGFMDTINNKEDIATSQIENKSFDGNPEAVKQLLNQIYESVTASGIRGQITFTMDDIDINNFNEVSCALFSEVSKYLPESVKSKLGFKSQSFGAMPRYIRFGGVNASVDTGNAINIDTVETASGKYIDVINKLFSMSEAQREKALNSITNVSPDMLGNVKFSDRNSNGKELSKGQQEYFKDSAVRDENGNLLVMYQGSANDFTVFDRKKSSYANLYGRGFYFTKSKAHAEQYGNSREFYLDIKNPLSPKQNAITKKQMLNFLKAIENDGEDYDLYNYGQDATAQTVLDLVWGKGDFEMLQDVSAGAIGDLVEAVELFNEVNGTSYDGIILPTETVTFNSEQAKLTSNLNPTKDKDIRFSDRDTDYMNAVESGDKETAQKMVDEAAKEAGYAINAYHGTPNNDFTVFDKNRVGKGTDQYGAGFYFASNKDAARAYGARVIDSRLALKNPIKIYGSTAEGANLIDAGFDHLLTESQAYEVIKRLPNIYDSEESPLGDYYDSYWENGAEEWMIEDLASNEFNRNIGYLDSDLFRNYPNELHEALREVVGYDGIEVAFSNGDKFYVAWFNNQMKSSEPVTYDDNGNVIPLSERFNKQNEDIRYSDRDNHELFNVSKEVEENLSAQIDNWLQGRMKSNDVFEFGKTPIILKELGADELPMIMTQDTMVKINGKKHDVALESIRKLPKNIADPVMVLKSDTVPNAFVILTEMDDLNGRPIVAALHLNKKKNRLDVNRITSIYGRNRIKYFLEEQAAKGNIRYINKIKSQNWSTSRGLKLPKLVQSNPDNNIILYKENIVNKYNAQKAKQLYSDREDTNIYDLMGENETLRKQNEFWKAEVERLKERLAIEKKVTKGNYFDSKQIGTVAELLRKRGNSDFDKVELMKELKEVYSYIAEKSNNIDEDYLKGKLREVAGRIVAESKPQTVTNDYSKMILKTIRDTRVTLNDTQKAEAQHIFGKNWNRNFIGRANIVTEGGTPLDVMWKEWASQYPTYFDENISDADMPGQLIDIIGSLQDTSVFVQEYDKELMTNDLAVEIFRCYWNLSPVKTTADKYTERINKLNADHKKALKELRDDYNERIKGQKLADDIHFGKMYQKLRDRKEKELSVAKQKGRERLESYKENAERKARIQSITANALTMNDLLKKNSKDKHVPDAMKGAVQELLTAINFSSKRLLEGGNPTMNDSRLANALKNLSIEINDSKASIHENLIDLYSSELPEKLTKLVKTVDTFKEVAKGHEFILNAMSVKDLKMLDDMLKIMRHAINDANKFHVTQHNAGVEALGIQSTQELDRRKKIYKNNKKHFDKFKTKTFWNNLTPYYAFKHMGEAAQKIFGAFQDGQDKMAFLAQEVINFAEETYKAKEYKEWSEKFFDFEVVQPNGETKKFSMNVPQIMSLYCVSKQEDALKHLLHGDENGEGGGITLVETDKTEAVLKNIMLTKVDLDKIIATLDNEEVGRAKEVADKLQEYMGTRGAELGNEISMARWGIKSFGIENYFPIKVSDGQVPSKGETPGVQSNSLIALLNMSFTHSRNEYANQSIEIGDMFDVFAKHMSSMIQYNAMALPVLDAYKWMKCRGRDENGANFSVETSTKDTFGNFAWEYLEHFMKDVNGVSKDNTRDNMGLKFFKNAKVAKVAFNIRVVALQFTSAIRAGAVMDNKYLLKAFLHKPKIAMSQEHCGIVAWKSLGYYDTDITRPLTAKIKHSDSVMDKIHNVSLWGAGKADEITLGYLWNACELEVREKRKDLKVGSEEFHKEIGTRLREVVYQTQVVDSQLTRSQMMRGSAWDKMLTSFASENALSFNLVTDMFVTNELDKRAYGKKYSFDKNKKRVRKTIIAYAVTGVVTAALQTMFDAFRDSDEEDKDEEYIAKLMLGNFANNVSFVNKLPYINLFISALSGFTPSRIEADWMDDASKMLKLIPKLLDGEEGSGEKVFRYMIKALSDATGVAAYNIYRDVMAFIELFGLND